MRRLTIRRAMLVVAGMGIVLCLARNFLPEPPEVVAYRKTAESFRRQAREWEAYARLSREAVTTLQPGKIDGVKGEYLMFNHYVPRKRPRDPAQASAFDGECEGVAAKCEAMRRYYDGLRKKWETAANRRWEVVPPDSPPPLTISADTNKDASF